MLLFVLGCNKETKVNWEHFYTYFPDKLGHRLIYRVDSVAYNPMVDSVIHYTYYVRETQLNTFLDLEGNQWRKVDHEIMIDSTEGWIPGSVYAQRITRGSAERVENNLRFIKLSFPLKKYHYWPGNSFIYYDDTQNCNFLGDWEYSYSDLYVEKEMNSMLFDSVVVVQCVADSGLICKNLWIEYYAPGIGLIQKYVERLSTQKTSSNPFYVKAENGYILRYSLIDWEN